MKKIFTVILLSALSLTALAQNQKIALLEPRVGEGSTEVTGMEKAMVRGELRKAIVTMPGYEAITRGDIDQMMKEQNFQRTGMVNDAQIKKMGEMSGADYICVSTLTKSNTEFYLEAYLIKLETGKMSNPASQYGELVNGKLANMLPVCEALAQELLGNKVSSSSSYKPATTHVSASSSSAKSTVTTTVTSTTPIVHNSAEYVDMGLPSGTLWKSENESCGHITYNEAISLFYNNLPTKEQWEELIGCCTWTWTGNGYNVVGKNNNSIFFPACGIYGDAKKKKCIKPGEFGMYWSSTPVDTSTMSKLVQKTAKNLGGFAWGMKLDKTGKVVGDGFCSWALSVRLVK